MKIIGIILLLLFLVSCSEEINSPVASNHSFNATDFPNIKDSKYLVENFVSMNHSLSPLKDYHFSMILGKNWKVQRINITSEPELDQMKEMALFSRYLPVLGKSDAMLVADISVYVTRVKSDTNVKQWLEKRILKFYGDKEYKIYQMIEVQGGYELLFGYQWQEKAYISRAFAYKFKDTNRVYALGKMDKLFMIQGNTQEPYYEKIAAEEFYLAPRSFRLG